MSLVYLSDLKNGETAIVKEVTAELAPVRFFELGIVPGAVLTVTKKMPFNGPISFTLRNGGKLAIRNSEAQLITVERA